MNKSIIDFLYTLLHYYNLNCPIKSKTIYLKMILKLGLTNLGKIKWNLVKIIIYHGNGKMSKSEYNFLRNSVTNSIRLCNKNHIFFKLDEFKCNIKTIWKKLNEVIHPNSNKIISNKIIKNTLQILKKYSTNEIIISLLWVLIYVTQLRAPRLIINSLWLVIIGNPSLSDAFQLIQSHKWLITLTISPATWKVFRITGVKHITYRIYHITYLNHSYK